MNDQALLAYIAEKGDTLKKVEMIGHVKYYSISTREASSRKTLVSTGYHTASFDTLGALYSYLRREDARNGWRIVDLSAI